MDKQFTFFFFPTLDFFFENPYWVEPSTLQLILGVFYGKVYTVLCYTIAKPGLCRVCKIRKSTPFTYDASVVFVKLDSNKKITNVGFAGLVMFWEWATSESQSLCCTTSWSMVDANRGRPTLRFKDVCKRGLKNLNVEKKVKNSSIRDLSRRIIQSRMSLIYFLFICFLLHHCVCLILV